MVIHIIPKIQSIVPCDIAELSWKFLAMSSPRQSKMWAIMQGYMDNSYMHTVSIRVNISSTRCFVWLVFLMFTGKFCPLSTYPNPKNTVHKSCPKIHAHLINSYENRTLWLMKKHTVLGPVLPLPTKPLFLPPPLDRVCLSVCLYQDKKVTNGFLWNLLWTITSRISLKIFGGIHTSI